MTTYKVVCLNCKQSDTVAIDDRNHIAFQYGKGVNTNITAARWRPDLKWGFECICGNYDLLAQNEDVDKYVNAPPLRLKQIIDLLKDTKPKFNFEVA